jgi:hypothetical protein
MKKTVGWIALLAATYVLVFIAGAAIGRRAALNEFVDQTKTAEAQLSLGRYVVYRDMAVALTKARYDSAKCQAEVLASSMLEDVKRCVAERACRAAIAAKAEQLAPETLGEVPVPFKYVDVNRTTCG